MVCNSKEKKARLMTVFALVQCCDFLFHSRYKAMREKLGTYAEPISYGGVTDTIVTSLVVETYP